MFISLCTKFCQVMLLFHCTTSYPEYDDEEGILDMDDLMKIRYRPVKRYIRPYEEINPKYFDVKDGANNNYSEETDSLSTIDLGKGLLLKNTDDLSQKDSRRTKNDLKLKELEDVILHPLWLTLPDQRLKKSKAVDTNRRHLTDLERIRRLQETIKDNLYKTDRYKKFWGKSNEADDLTVKDKNDVKNPNEFGDFEYENQLVLRSLNDFYLRLLNSLVEVVPSLKIEDPFFTDENLNQMKPYFKNFQHLEGTTTPASFQRNTLGDYIEKKVENLKKEPSKYNFPEFGALSNILQNFPLIVTNISDKDDRILSLDKMASKPTLFEINDEKLPKHSLNENNFLQFIPQIKYSFDVDKNATTIARNKNSTTTKMWYYSNYYTETPVMKLETTTKPIENATTESLAQWPLENIKFYKNIPNLRHLLRSSDMRGRIEWENTDENENAVAANTRQELRTTEGIKVRADGPQWFKTPLKSNLESIFNNADRNNNHISKCRGKLCNLIKNNYNLANRKYIL
ncbi:uncharacterized protein [Rhodnius prolixus]|uniref:uncharacterized protein n=1 Tax=Rhodnius prolixus TaxID=13249 RepID=UPI003D18A1BD